MELENSNEKPVLINRFRLNEANMLSSAKEQLRTTLLLNYVFSAVMLALAVYLTVFCFRAKPFDARLLFRPLVCIGIAGFLFYQARTVEKRSVSRIMQSLEDQLGTRDSEVILSFAPDCFFSENSSRSGLTRREYPDVTRLTRGKTWIYLTMRGVGGFTLDPARFENGAEADFWKLMNEKCPRAVPKKHRPGQPNA